MWRYDTANLHLENLTQRQRNAMDKREDKLKPDLQKKLEALKQTVAMLTETQAIRAKNGQPEADDLSQGMSLLRVQLHTLEKAVYGSSIAAMKARTENLERALNGHSNDLRPAPARCAAQTVTALTDRDYVFRCINAAA
jgi:hypothetical protein